MTLIRKLALNNIFKNKRGSLLTIVSVALSVSLTTMVVSVMFGLYNEIKRDTLENHSQENVTIYLVKDIENLIDGIGRDVIDTYGAEIYNYSFSLSNQPDSPHYELIGRDTQANKAFLPLSSDSYNHITITSGRDSQNPNEVVISQELVQQSSENSDSVKLGDTINIEKRSYREDSDQPVVEIIKEATIVGFTDSWRSYYHTDTKSLPILTSSDVTSGYNLLIKFKDGTKNIDDYVNKGLSKDNTNSFTDEKGVEHFSTYYNEEYNTYKGMQSAFTATQKVLIGTTIFFVLILSASTFSLIFNAFNVLVEQNVHTYGLLRSVGATRPQIRRIVRLEGYSLSILGIIFGCGIGYSIAYRLTSFINYQIDISRELYGAGLSYYFTANLPWWCILIVALLSLLMTTIPLNRTIRRLFALTSVESIRKTEKKRKRKAKKTATLNSKTSLPLQIAHINNKNAQTKVRGIQSTLVISITMFIAISSILASTLTQVDPENNSYNLESYIHSRYYEQAKTLSHEYVKVIEEDQNIVDYHVKTRLHVAVLDTNYSLYPNNKDLDYEHNERLNEYSENATVFIISNDDYKILCDLNNLTCNQEGGALMYNLYEGTVHQYAQDLSNEKEFKGAILDINESDSFRVVSHQSEYSKDLNPDAQEYTLDGFITETPDYLYPSGSNIPLVSIYLPERLEDQLMSSFTHVDQDRYGGVFSGTTIYMESKDPYASEALFDDLKTKYDGQSGISNYAKQQASSRQIASTIQILVSSVLLFIGSVSIMNMINITITNFNLRKQTLASYQSIGMTKKQLDSMYLYESLIQFSKPLILGIGLGSAVSYLFYFIVSMQIDSSDFKFSFDVKSFLIAFLFITIAILINFMTLRVQSKRLSLVENMREL